MLSAPPTQVYLPWPTGPRVDAVARSYPSTPQSVVEARDEGAAQYCARPRPADGDRSDNPAVVEAARRIRGYMRPYPARYTRAALELALDLSPITLRRALARLRTVEGSVELIEGKYYGLREGYRPPVIDEPSDRVLVGLHVAVAHLRDQGLDGLADELVGLLEELDLRARQQRSVVSLGPTSPARSGGREDRTGLLAQLLAAVGPRRPVRLLVRGGGRAGIELQIRGVTVEAGRIVVFGQDRAGRSATLDLDHILAVRS